MLRLRYQLLTNGGWPLLMRRLESHNYRAAIVGPFGSGKTTLLEDMGVRLHDQGFRIHSIFLNEQNRYSPHEFMRNISRGLTRNDIVLLDGCEQLSPFNWQLFRWETRRAGGLVVTTHRTGRLPRLWQCETNLELLNDLIRQLLNDKVIQMTSVDIGRLFERHNGNLREALRELYDIASYSR